MNIRRFLILVFVTTCLAVSGCNSGADTTDADLDGDTSEGPSSGGDPDEIEKDVPDGDQELDGDDGNGNEDGDGEKENELEASLPTCNGYSELCSRRFDEAAYPVTHNSMSNHDENWIAPNQIHNITTQLEDGVRGFMLDTYLYKGGTWLCHGDCLFGKKKLSEGLAEFTAFLKKRPGEVLTLIFESSISADETEQAFREAGLLGYVHTQIAGEPWPTLGEMSEAGRRVVVFTDFPNNGPAWYHDVWEYCWDTPWHVTAPEQFVCDVSRGSRQNSLFILNHMLYGGLDLPSEQQAGIANSNPFFLDRANRCWTETERLPNFVTVDFYSIGDLFEVVDSLNGISSPVSSL